MRLRRLTSAIDKWWSGKSCSQMTNLKKRTRMSEVTNAHTIVMVGLMSKVTCPTVEPEPPASLVIDNKLQSMVFIVY